jgi:hypothetical protein
VGVAFFTPNFTNLPPFRRATWRAPIHRDTVTEEGSAVRAIAVFPWAAWLAIVVLTTAVAVHAYGRAGAGDNGGEAGGKPVARL